MNIINRVKIYSIGKITLANYIFNKNLLFSYQNVVIIYYYYAAKQT